MQRQGLKATCFMVGSGLWGIVGVKVAAVAGGVGTFSVQDAYIFGAAVIVTLLNYYVVSKMDPGTPGNGNGGAK